MLNDSFDIVWIEGIENIEEIFSIWQVPFSQLVWKESHEIRILSEYGIEILYRELIISGHVDKLDILKLIECLLLFEN